MKYTEETHGIESFKVTYDRTTYVITGIFLSKELDEKTTIINSKHEISTRNYKFEEINEVMFNGYHDYWIDINNNNVIKKGISPHIEDSEQNEEPVSFDARTKIRLTIIAALLTSHLGIGLLVIKAGTALPLFLALTFILSLLAGFIMCYKYIPKGHNRIGQTVDYTYKKFWFFRDTKKLIDRLIMTAVLSFFVGISPSYIPETKIQIPNLDYAVCYNIL